MRLAFPYTECIGGIISASTETTPVAKLFCSCGRLIRFSGEVPNPREWKLVPDDELHGHAARLSVERIALEAASLIRCPDCRSVWIYWKGYDHEPTEYRPADG